MPLTEELGRRALEYADKYSTIWLFCRATYKRAKGRSRQSHRLHTVIKLANHRGASACSREQPTRGTCPSLSLSQTSIDFTKIFLSESLPCFLLSHVCCPSPSPHVLSLHSLKAVSPMDFSLCPSQFPFLSLRDFASLKFLINQAHFITQTGLRFELNCNW